MQGSAQAAYLRRGHAGIAQLVERNLAKVEVGSSRLLSRSNMCTKGKPMLPLCRSCRATRRAQAVMGEFAPTAR